MSRTVIVDWSAVSAYGHRAGDFADGIVTGAPTAALLDPAAWDVPDTHAYVVPGFTAKAVLGRQGTRSMDRLTALAVTAVGHLVHDRDGARRPALGDGTAPDADTAIVLGTTTGSQQSMTDITRDTLVHEKPFYIQTANIPNALANSAAAQCAIWYQLRGPNTTVAAGRMSGLSALTYGRRLLAAGRASTVLCGAAEEYSVARSWWEWHSRTHSERDTRLGEGCAMVRLQTARDADGWLAELLTIESGVHDGDPAPALTECVHRALRHAGAGPQDVWAVAGSGDKREWAVLDAVFEGYQPQQIGRPVPFGDTGGAAAAFQLVSVLGLAAHDPAASGRLAVITTIDPDAVHGVALLRLR